MKHFTDMASVEEEANRTIQQLLSDRSLINPERFGVRLRQYEKRQAKLDAEASESIRNQIENIGTAKRTIEEASKSMAQSKQKIDQINILWRRNLKFHEAYPQIHKLYLYQKNIISVIEQLGHFLNLEQQLKDIRALIQDDANLEQVHQRILNLTDLRDNVMGKVAGGGQDLSIIRRQFSDLEQLESQFQKMLYQRFSNCVKIAKSNPALLISAVKIVERDELAALNKNRKPYLRQKILSIISSSIDERFSKQLGDANDFVEIAEKSKFVSQDLVEVLEKVAKCFPSHYNIFDFYQERYQKNIEQKILPHLEILTEEKQYGNLLVLMTWIEDYEAVLARAGVNSMSYAMLKAKVKELMPMFIEHNQKVLREYIENCLQKDSVNFNRDFYEELIRQKSEFISNYPSDIFSMVNKQADIVKGQVRGQLFIQFVRCIATELREFQEKLMDDFKEEYQKVKLSRNETAVVNYEYKLILNMNNFNECLKNSREATKEYKETVAEQYRDRVNKIFLTEVQKPFDVSTKNLMDLIVRVLFLDLYREYISQLFTERWIDEKGKKGQLVEGIVSSGNFELKEIQTLANNPANYRRLVGLSYKYLVDIYCQQLIFSIRQTYGMSMSGWLPERLDLQLADMSYKKQRNNRKIMSKNTIAQQIGRDIEMFMKLADEMKDEINRDDMGKLQQKLTLIRDFFSKNKLQIESLLESLNLNYPLQAEHLLQAVMCIREELDRGLPGKLEDIQGKKA